MSVNNFIKDFTREEKEQYLNNIGLFKPEALKEMTDKEIDTLVISALESQGVI